MNTMQIEMEDRLCKKCGKKYRVMVTSQQSVCSTACDRYGIPVRGAAQRASKENGANRGKLNVTVTAPTKPTEPGKTFEARVGEWPTRKNLEKNQNSITKPTRGGSMQEELNGGGKIKSVSLPPNARTTTPTASETPPPSEIAETSETLPVLSAESQRHLAKAGLDSMSLLNKSANKLMKIMDGCVSDSDLERASDGGMKVESHRGEQAIQCANAIAHTIQTQINMVKAMTAFVRPK